MPDKGILILYGSLSKNRALLACSEKCNITFFKKQPKTPRQNGPLCPVVVKDEIIQSLECHISPKVLKSGNTMGLVLWHFQKPAKTPPTKRRLCSGVMKGDLFRPSSDTQLNTGPKGTFLVSALKYQAKLTSTSPWPSIPEESDKGDKSESGLQPEGGDDRYKGIMILLRSHRPSVESGSKSAREPSHPMSAAGSNSTGVKVPWSRNSNARALRSTTLLLLKMEFCSTCLPAILKLCYWQMSD